MANELTFTNNADLRVAAVLSKEVHRLLSDRVDLRHIASYRGNLAGSGSNVLKTAQVLYDEVAASTAEAADVANSALGDGAANITVARYAVRYDVADLYALTGGPGHHNIADLAGGIVDACTRAASGVLATSFAGFTDVEGTSGAALTVDDVMAAQADLIQAGADPDVWCVLARKQMTDLQTSFNGYGGPSSYQKETADTLRMIPQGYAFSWNGIRFATSGQVTDDSTDYFGAMFDSKALGWADASPDQIRSLIGPNAFLSVQSPGSPIFIEIQRDASKGLTEVVGNLYFGAVMLEDDRGATIQTGM